MLSAQAECRPPLTGNGADGDEPVLDQVQAAGFHVHTT